MTKVRVDVTYKASILDPQAQAIKGAAGKMGFEAISDIKVGKFFDLDVAGNADEAVALVSRFADELLANPNMETFTVKVLDEAEVGAVK